MSDTVLIVILNVVTGLAALAAVWWRPARLPTLVAMAASHFGIALIFILLLLRAGGIGWEYGVGMVFYGTPGTLLGGAIAALARWRFPRGMRRRRRDRFVAFQGPATRFVYLQRFLAELDRHREARQGGATAEADLNDRVASPRWIEALDADTSRRVERMGLESFRKLVRSLLVAESQLQPPLYFRDRGQLPYVPQSMGGDDEANLKALIELFGLEVTGGSVAGHDSRDRSDGAPTTQDIPS